MNFQKTKLCDEYTSRRRKGTEHTLAITEFVTIESIGSVIERWKVTRAG
jgi:hypothetical protein